MWKKIVQRITELIFIILLLLWHIREKEGTEVGIRLRISL